jgi:nicotinate-nucleotide--dimethylbenzimidazole phosphoribosyltransferase
VSDSPELAAVLASVARPDEDARRAARERLAAGAARGRLDELAGWLSGVQGAAAAHPFDRVRLLLVAADHGVADADVSNRAHGDTEQLVRDTTAGTSPVALLAASVGVSVRPEAAAPAAGARVDRADAMSLDDALAAVLRGVAIVDEEVDGGSDLLVLADVGRGVGTVASALVGVLTKRDASVVTSRGAAIDDARWMRRCAVVRDTMRRGRPVLGEHVALLATIGGPDLATATGILLGAAARRTPVVLDGIAAAAAALVAQRMAFRAVDWWLAGHLNPEPAHAIALDRLGLKPVLDLGIRQEDGTGALLAVPVLRAAAELPLSSPGGTADGGGADAAQ